MANPVVEKNAHPKSALHLSAGRFAGLLLLLTIASFPDVLLLGKNFFARDFALFGYPLAYYHRESFWRGEMPLWNPLSNFGLPFLAQWNTLVLYPPSFIYLVLPLPWSLSFFCLAHFFLGGLGMYFLARRWAGSDLAASVAGLAFVFNGFSLNCLAWPNNMAAWAWLPWLMWQAERAWSEGGRRIVIAALIGTVQMLAGAPEIILFTWGLITVFWLEQLWTHRRIRWIGRFLLLVGLIAALSSAQLLPFLDLMRHSDRDTSVGVGTWVMPSLGWLNFFVPVFGCIKTASGVFLQKDQYWTSSYYPGATVVVLALAAVVLARTRRVGLLWLIVLGSLAMALGDNGWAYPMAQRFFPQIGFMRFVIKFIVPALFAFPLLAALALAALERNENVREQNRTLTATWLLATSAMGFALWMAFSHPEPADNWPVVWPNALNRLLFLTATLWLIAKTLTQVKPSSRFLGGLALLLLFWFDFITHVPRQNHTTDASVYEPKLGVQQLPQPLVPGTSRAMISFQTRYQMNRSGVSDPVHDLLGKRLAFFANNNLLDDVPKCDGFFSLYLQKPSQINRQITESPAATVPESLLDFLAVSHVSSATNLVEWDYRPTHHPFILIGAQPRFLPPTEIRPHLFSTEFDARQVVYLPTAARAVITATQAANGRILSSHFGAQRVEFAVEADQPAMVTIAQSFHHFWQARVDGKPIPLWEANDAFQAVEVPAGRHHVTLTYEDTSFRQGSLISLLTLAGCGLAGVAGGRSRKKTIVESDSETSTHGAKM